MGLSAETGLGHALFGRVRQRVLGILMSNPGRSYYGNEVIRLADAGRGAVQRELANLRRAGIVNTHQAGNQVRYRANEDSPVFQELRGLVLKTSGLADVLAEALAPLAGGIRAAFVFGSIARQEDRASSDVDLMVISDDHSYGEIFAALEPAAARLGRAVNPKLYTSAEFSRRLAEGQGFLSTVLNQPKIWIIGGEHDLAA